MRLSLRDKHRLYAELGELLRSGRPLPGAVETLASEHHGGTRRVLEKLREKLAAGATAGEAWKEQTPAVSHLEYALVGAGETSGRLDDACRHLADYFNTLATLREKIIRGLAYPVFVLFFGVFILGLPTAIQQGGAAYARETLGILGVVVGGAILLLLLTHGLRSAAEGNRIIDAVLRVLPGVGKVRRSFSLARFCTTYSMHLDAGINVIDSLRTAAAVSQSALIRQVTKNAIPDLRRGGQLAPLLGRSRVFPERMLRALRIGEETGGLDKQLQELSEDFQREGLVRVETLSQWIPRIIYIFILGYVGYRIIAVYQGVLRGYEQMLG